MEITSHISLSSCDLIQPPMPVSPKCSTPIHQTVRIEEARPAHLYCSTSYSSVSSLKYSSTCLFSLSASAESSINRTAASRPLSALWRSPLAATGVNGCKGRCGGSADFPPPPLKFLESRGRSTQNANRQMLISPASWFSGMRTVKNWSAGKSGPTDVEERWCV